MFNVVDLTFEAGLLTVLVGDFLVSVLSSVESFFSWSLSSMYGISAKVMENISLVAASLILERECMSVSVFPGPVTNSADVPHCTDLSLILVFNDTTLSAFCKVVIDQTP